MNMHYVNIIIFMLIIFIDSTYSVCDLNIKKNFGNYAPLLLDVTGKGFIYPQKPFTKTIIIPSNGKVLASCPGGSIMINHASIQKTEIILTCVKDSIFRTSDDEHEFTKIRCSFEHSRKISVRRAKRCYNGDLIEIGFESVSVPFIPTLNICYNTITAEPYWAHSVIPCGILDNEKKQNRYATFSSAEFSNDIDINNAYSKEEQRKMFLEIMNQKEALVDKYIQITDSKYLIRSLLVSRADQFYLAQQNSTYFYLNVIPVWKSISVSNLKMIQSRVKQVARFTGDLDVYTGGLYTLRLPFTPTDTREIFLTKNKATGVPSIFVPKLVFKLVYNRQIRSAIVIITINNPYLKAKNIPKDYIICEEFKACLIGNKDILEPEKGYSYCCLYEDFIKDEFAQKIGLPRLPNVVPLIV